jgi:ribA/ribD-fused uncharacterized protein
MEKFDSVVPVDQSLFAKNFQFQEPLIDSVSQNKELGDFLKSTEGKLLVEANPYDKIWGVGLAEDDYLILDCHNWLGTNWLGEVLTKVRITLFGN